MKHFNTDEINELLNNNSEQEHGRRNAALIMGGIFWGLSPIELSLITVEDVIAPNGEFYEIWILPEHASFNGTAREVHTEDHVLPFFEGYAKHRVKNGQGVCNLSSHMTLDPKSNFFLNDKGEPYKLTRTERPGGKATYQARSMNEQLKRMLAKTSIQGATPSSYRETFIKSMYDGGCHWKELMKVTGYKHKKTLENKVRPETAEIEQIFKTIYRGVKMPWFNDDIED